MKGNTWIVATALLAALWPAGRTSAGAAPATSWMHVDSTAKSVGLDIQMAENGNNGTFNFNGYARGELTITVPVGWKVQMHVVNTGEGAIPHSLEIAKVTEAMPAQGVDPAFSQAYTVQLIPGMAVGAKDEVEFTASEPGKYWMLCGVPGHAAGGMWDWFVISSTASAPSVTIGKGS